MAVQSVEAGDDAVSRFYLSPVVPAATMIANMRSSLARGLPEVSLCKPHDRILSVAGGGPSLADTFRDLTGFVGAVNGSLAWLLDRETTPGACYACGVMDAGAHIADALVADPQVRYYVASICDPRVFDKLADCDVRIWHVTPESTEDPDGIKAVLDAAYPDHWRAIRGGCTMGLRWINLGYVLGFRRFHLHGLDSSFRGDATHSYPDRADSKDRIVINGWETRPNFLAQVYDFFRAVKRLSQFDHDPIELEVYGTGLLQEQWRSWKSRQVDLPLICCVKTGDKYSNEYVTRLRDGVARNLARPHRFVCFTDAPVDGVECAPLPADLPGWWAKIGLLKLKRPLIYFDLDVVITGDLEPLLAWDGFGIIKDWWQPGFNSSVMKLTGRETFVWENFTPAAMRSCPHGDQQFISQQIPDGRTFPGSFFPSYKANRCHDAVPPGALAVVFHGEPKPHQCGGWVADRWRERR